MSKLAVLRRRPLQIALAALCLILASLAYVLIAGRGEPSAPLGASVAVPGGVARINGVIPLEADGWMPVGGPSELTGPVQEGSHRVRVLVELTVLEAQGLQFSAGEYSIDSLGTDASRLLWSSPERKAAAQGETIQATLVFDIPDQAIVLVLEGRRGIRLSLGTGHHTGAP